MCSVYHKTCGLSSVSKGFRGFQQALYNSKLLFAIAEVQNMHITWRKENVKQA